MHTQQRRLPRQPSQDISEATHQLCHSRKAPVTRRSGALVVGDVACCRARMVSQPQPSEWLGIRMMDKAAVAQGDPGPAFSNNVHNLTTSATAEHFTASVAPLPDRTDRAETPVLDRVIGNGSPLCQDTAAGTGVRSAVSPGSGLSEVLAMGIRSAALDVSVAPKCPSRTFVVWSSTSRRKTASESRRLRQRNAPLAPLPAATLRA